MENGNDKRRFLKILYILQRLIHDWADTSISQVFLPEFKAGYIPAFMCIGMQGISNNEVAKELKVSKMAASKVIKELMNLKLIRSERSTLDGRSEILYLTKKGEAFSKKVSEMRNSAEEEYRKVAGSKNYEKAIDVLLEIIQFHEALQVKKTKLDNI
ncbi:MAG TPA: MarR family winged helix-turn-helix transcriptional regulator [Puia sp.]|nr:MarR family winged helix-turn-helix transcriptional regulator [Puia sp.]